MFILLPPSEGKSPDAGTGVFRDLEPDLVRDAAPVFAQLRKLKAAGRARVYHVSNEAKARAAHAKNLGVLDAPALPALERYTGVVYQHLDYASLKTKRQAAKRIGIVSGLFGLIRGSSRIPDYKLPLNPWLTRYWKPINSSRLANIAQGKPVLNLLPQTHARTIDYPHLIRVDFKLQGGKKSAGHFGKAIKGRFVRFLIEKKVTRIEDFHAFREDGFEFDGQDFIAR